MADDDDIQWQEEFKVRVSSGFDRLVAFAATELNRRSIEEERVSPKREIPPYVDHYRPSHHMKKEDVRKMKPERDYASDLSNERRMRMMIEENRKSKHHLQHHQQQDE